MPYAIPAMLSASLDQIGAAAVMRDRVNEEDRSKLNYVVHSSDRTQTHGVNPFAAHPGYDPAVADLLKDVVRRNQQLIRDLDLTGFFSDLAVGVRKSRAHAVKPT
jgi:hypothetical protein